MEEGVLFIEEARVRAVESLGATVAEEGEEGLVNVVILCVRAEPSPSSRKWMDHQRLRRYILTNNSLQELSRSSRPIRDDNLIEPSGLASNIQP